METDVPLAERRVIDSAFEGLFKKALAKELTPRLKRRLSELGVDLDGKLKPIYPHQVWLAALTATAEELMPGVPVPEALERLGGRVVSGYFETFIGSALKALLSRVGVRRSLGRMTQNFSASNNYTRCELTEVAEKHVQLWMNELTETRHNTLGILRTGLKLIGGKEVQVEMTAFDDRGATYDIRWG